MHDVTLFVGVHSPMASYSLNTFSVTVELSNNAFLGRNLDRTVARNFETMTLEMRIRPCYHET